MVQVGKKRKKKGKKKSVQRWDEVIFLPEVRRMWRHRSIR